MEYDELEQEVEKLRQTVLRLSAMMNERDKSAMAGADLINKLAHICDSLGNTMEGLLKQHRALDHKVSEMLDAMQKMSNLCSDMNAASACVAEDVQRLKERVKRIEGEIPSTMDHEAMRQREAAAAAQLKSLGVDDGGHA